MSSSTFLYHEACPACGSSDARAVYDDGHSHCFSCGRHDQGDPDALVPSTPHEPRSFHPLGGSVEALPERGLTAETCARFGYAVGELSGEAVHIAPYRDAAGTLVAQHVRFLDPKRFLWLGKPSDALLFGQRERDAGNRRLVVAEGELDALSIAQVQGKGWPVVSIKNGAASAAKEIEAQRAWVESFAEVVFAFDMDDPGQQAARTCATLLSPGKARIARLPAKDANEALLTGKVSELREALWKAVPFDAERRLRELLPPGLALRVPREPLLVPGLVGEDKTASLLERATQIAIQSLERANVLSEPHQKLVGAMVETTVRLVVKSLRGRWAVAAPVGIGKTTVIRATIQALHEAGLDVGVLVLQEQIAAGNETILALEEAGVPIDAMAHVHSKAHEDYRLRSWPSEAARAPFVFATHRRSHVASLTQLLQYRDRPRALLVDEALHSTWAIGIDLADALNDLQWTASHLDKKTSALHQRMQNWVSSSRWLLFEIVEALKIAAKYDGSVGLPTPPTGDELDAWCEVLDHTRAGSPAKTVKALLEAATIDPSFRVLRIGDAGYGGVIQHRRILPAQVRDVLIFDAGVEIDQLAALDPGLRRAHEELPWFEGVREPSRVKNWSAVQIYWARNGGGRNTMRQQYRRAGATRRRGRGQSAPVWAPDAVAEFARDHCLPGEILFCTFLDTDLETDFQRVQQEALERAGVDLERCRWTTWGRHHSSNAWQDVANVISVGAWHQDRLRVISAAIAQKLQPLASVPTTEEVSEILSAQLAGFLYQLAGRGVARQVDGGRAKPMVFAFITNDAGVRRFLERVMPGARWSPWGIEGAPDPDRRRGLAKATLAGAERLAATLEEMRLAGETLPTALEGVAERAEVKLGRDALRTALELALEDPRSEGWEILNGVGLVYTPPAF